ncbi:hypothetical protein ACO0QE_002722 [Hanseniaspora vineae]
MNKILTQEINASLSAIIELLGPYTSETDKLEQTDDVEILINWMDPIEQQHGFKPPPLRVKKIINSILETGKAFKYTEDSPYIFPRNNSSFFTQNNEVLGSPYINNIDKAGIIERHLLSIYFTQARLHFFTNFQNITNLQMASKLEKLYRFPKEFCFQRNEDIFENEILIMRKYLLNKNHVLEQSVVDLLKLRNLQKDLVQVNNIYKWMSSVTEGRFLLIDLMLDTVKSLCSSVCEQSESSSATNVVDLIYSQFYHSFWVGHYESMMGISNSEEKNELLNEIKLVVISEFVQVCAVQSFELCVKDLSHSYFTLAELKPILMEHPQLCQLFAQNLSDQISRRLLQSSVPTATLLYSYLQVFKALTFLDASSKTLKQTVLSKLVGTLRDRLDMTKIFLYALFNLSAYDIALIDDAELMLDFDTLAKIHHELGSRLDFETVSVVTGDTVLGHSLFHPPNSMMAWFDKEYLEWQPEAIQDTDKITNYNSFIKLLKKTVTHDVYPRVQQDGFDAVFYIIFNNNKTRILSETNEIMKNLLLVCKEDSLKPEWQDCLLFLENKFQSRISGNELSLLNNLNIMLYDFKKSAQMRIEGLHTNMMLPKVTSYIYWEMLENYQKSSQIQLPLIIQREFDKLNNLYSRGFQNGRRLKMYADKGLVELRLTFSDGRVFEKDVLLFQALVINCFNDNDLKETGSSGLSLESITQKLKIEQELVSKALQFWISEKVMYGQNGQYFIIENLSQYENSIKKGGKRVASLEHGGPGKMKNSATNEGNNQDSQLIKLMEKVKPFILGMVTNHGSMKAAKMFSFLSMTVPKELGFKCTQTQLQAYLDILVQEKVLTVTSKGAYKLSKK